MSEWREVTIGELCEEGGGNVQTGPFGSQLKASAYVPNGIPTVMPANLVDFRISEEGIARISREDHQRLSKHHLRPGDIVYGRRGEIGRHALVTEKENGWLCGTGCLRIRFGDAGVEPRYVSYYLRQPEVIQMILGMAVGTTMPNLNTTIVKSIPLRLPPLPVQRRIAQILGRLDDKIEVNRRINRTLEAMARALYRHWFVDFGPFQDGEFVESELGLIPRGWEVGRLGDLCEKPRYGFTATAQTEPVGPKFLRITDINKRPWIRWEDVPYCRISPKNYEKYHLRFGDILIARMADPGHGCMIEEEVDAVFASYLIRFRPQNMSYSRFIQYWLRSKSYWNLVDGSKAGTTRATLNAKQLSNFSLVIPPIFVAENFTQIISPLRKMVVQNVREIQKLIESRDYLLPRLLSGEVVIDEHSFH